MLNRSNSSIASIPLGHDNGRPHNCPSLEQLIEQGCGYLIAQSENRAQCTWRSLFPNFGDVTTLPNLGVCYTIATDGVHIVLWTTAHQRWIDVAIDNWNGPVSLHDESPKARACLGFVELRERDHETSKLRKGGSGSSNSDRVAREKRMASMVDDLVL